jgi:hypothetical protein
MLIMPLAQSAECFLAIHQFAAFGLRIAVFDLCADISAILSQPLLVFMQHLNRLSDKFIGGLVGAAFHVFLD